MRKKTIFVQNKFLKQITMNVLLNFGGFYHTEHSESVDSKIELFGLDWEKVDYKKTYIEYSKALISEFSECSDLELNFVGLDSPKFYNFTTDKIEVEISENDIKTLEAYIENEDFKRYADPFFNGIADLIQRAKTDETDNEILFGMVLDYIYSENIENIVPQFIEDYDIVES